MSKSRFKPYNYLVINSMLVINDNELYSLKNSLL